MVSNVRHNRCATNKRVWGQVCWFSIVSSIYPHIVEVGSWRYYVVWWNNLGGCKGNSLINTVDWRSLLWNHSISFISIHIKWVFALSWGLWRRDRIIICHGHCLELFTLWAWSVSWVRYSWVCYKELDSILSKSVYLYLIGSPWRVNLFSHSCHSHEINLSYFRRAIKATLRASVYRLMTSALSYEIKLIL